jgi:hypothetical protein
MSGYLETGFPITKALTTEFTKQYPNVKWDIREDQFAVITQNAPRVLADDPPDLTQGGPGNATMVPGLEIHYQAFSERQVGVASALAVVLMVLVLVCVLPIQWVTRDRDR